MVVHAPTIWCHHLNLFRSDKFRKVRTDEAGYAGHAIFAGYVEFLQLLVRGSMQPLIDLPGHMQRRDMTVKRFSRTVESADHRASSLPIKC